jgi:hypothetical protein
MSECFENWSDLQVEERVKRLSLSQKMQYRYAILARLTIRNALFIAMSWPEEGVSLSDEEASNLHHR